MNIWLLQIGEPLPIQPGMRKMRSALLAETLASRGHQVLWWASAFDHLSKRMLFRHDTTLHFAPALSIRVLCGIAYTRNVSLRRYLDHRLIAAKFAQQSSALHAPDLILASMPDHHLACQAVKYARARRIPVIVDVRDPWPHSFLDVLPIRQLKPVLKLLLHEDFRRAEWALQHATAITSMSPALLDWALTLARRGKKPEDRVFYLGARPPAAIVQPGDASGDGSGDFNARLNSLKDSFVVCFIGSFGRMNNPHIIAQAARMLSRDPGRGSIAFIIAGDGPFFQEVAREAAGLSSVWLPGWVTDNQIAAILGVSSVGVIPCPEAMDIFPNKAFTYLSAGLPVISSACGDFRTLITERALGLNYNPGDLTGLVEAIKALAYDRDRHRQYAKNAQAFFAAELDARMIYQDFAAQLESLARPG